MEARNLENKLEVIDQRKLFEKNFRIFGNIDNPLFLAKDVAEWIGYDISNVSKMVKNIDEDEKIIARKNNTSATFLTEDGLYEVLFQSRKPIAKKFKKEVKKILKDIRKHGMYAKDELLDNPDLLFDVIAKYKQEREEKKKLKLEIETNKPKIIFADAVSTSKTCILVGELAKILKQNGVDTGQNRFFEWLRENGYLVKRKGTDYNMPTQKSYLLDLFEIKETSVTHSDGHISLNKTPKVTGKGQQYFINKFLKRDRE